MDDWLTFEAHIEPLEWGRATYTILRVPPEVADALLARRAKRVEGEINDHPVNLALSRAPVVDGVFLWAGKSLLGRLAIAPGEPLEVRLRPVPADDVEMPDDLMAALHAAGRTEHWHRLTPGRRRSLLYRLNSAKTAGTREKRLAAIVAGLGS